MGSLSGLEKRFQRSVANEEYYVAEQTCRTIYHRLTHPKDQSQLDLPRAFERISIATITLLEHGRAQEGTALALLCVKHLTDYKVHVVDDELARLKMIARKYKDNRGGKNVKEMDEQVQVVLREKVRFLRSVISWTKTEGIEGRIMDGDEWFNGELGECLGRLNEFKPAMKALVLSDRPNLLAEIVDRWVRETGLKSERDLFLCRTILLYVVSGNLRDGNKMFTEFQRLSEWKSYQDRPPLANFCELLLTIAQYNSKAAKLYQKLVNTYKVSLDRDPELQKLTTEIGEKYFSIKPQKSGGVLGMMEQMFGGMMQ